MIVGNTMSQNVLSRWTLALLGMLTVFLDFRPSVQDKRTIHITVHRVPSFDYEGQKAATQSMGQSHPNWIVRYSVGSQASKRYTLILSDHSNTCFIDLNTVGQDVGCHFTDPMLGLSIKDEAGQLIGGISIFLTSPSGSDISCSQEDAPTYITL